ncbi:PREDICTED: endonuclease V-like [Priapulus caudatus]|uniref:Endonuclease V-like n=1 Tax=Priapulus caudatus TaxID=37621 RepID=A0ABM1EP24_PRICU|nr:PREDICTED: endonuclease V-like [Priapulus caudatus]
MQDRKDELKTKWKREQNVLKKGLVLEDSASWCTSWDNEQKTFHEELHFIGGVDISFVKEDAVNACAALAIVSFPDLELVYSKCKLVQLDTPYIPGFLAFREVQFHADLVQELKASHPEFFPQVILVDGNGVFHSRGFGLASHLGVLLGIPTVGIGKTLYCVDGIEKNQYHTDQIKRCLLKGGDTFDIVGISGTKYAVALRTCDNSKNPVYVSIGHGVSLATAIRLAVSCCKYRIPEPIRQADILSREQLRLSFPAAVGQQRCEQKLRKARSQPKPLDSNTGHANMEIDVRSSIVAYQRDCETSDDVIDLSNLL